MKDTPHIKQTNRRHESEARVARNVPSVPRIDQRYQDPQLQGACGTPAKFHRPAFFEISNRYFADEAANEFLVDAGVFGALILSGLLPIASSVQAVATVLHSISVI